LGFTWRGGKRRFNPTKGGDRDTATETNNCRRPNGDRQEGGINEKPGGAEEDACKRPMTHNRGRGPAKKQLLWDLFVGKRDWQTKIQKKELHKLEKNGFGEGVLRNFNHGVPGSPRNYLGKGSGSLAGTENCEDRGGD